MSNDTNIVGGRQLSDFLRTLAPKVEKNIMRSALRAGAVVYAEKVKENIPVRLGPLKKSVRVSTRVKSGVVISTVKAGNKRAWYAELVEYGTRAHKIKPKNTKALVIGSAVVREVDHPGAKPHPYMRPAADSSHDAAVAAVATVIRERLTLHGIDIPAPENV